MTVPKRVLPLLTLPLSYSVQALAVPASPGVREIAQPGGSVVKVLTKRDERNNWFEKTHGYVVAPGDQGSWYYVEGYEKGRSPVLPRERADRPAPPGLQKRLIPPRRVGANVLESPNPADALSGDDLKHHAISDKRSSKPPVAKITLLFSHTFTLTLKDAPNALKQSGKLRNDNPPKWIVPNKKS